ncbi:MAG TPA: hypothetical protein V6C81_05190 [Planktothrix sp.]|jgi:protein tyrosine phosphatase (PTP) superfamily phosphohydrolase (DUF442 family)
MPQITARRNARLFNLLIAAVALCSLAPTTPAAHAADDLCEVKTAIAEAPNLVPNFEKVDGGIWRGSAPTTAALDALKHDGVKTIVDLRLDGDGVAQESARAKALGVKYYHFALGFNKPQEKELSDILAVMTDPINQPVFVHCRQGADRTGMLVGLYRRKWQGWTFKQAYVEMRQHHFKPFLWHFKQEVERATPTTREVAAKPEAPAISVQKVPQHVLVSSTTQGIN